MKQLLIRLIPLTWRIAWKKRRKPRNERDLSSMRAIFEAIYHRNDWGNDESVSGPGSQLSITHQLIPPINDLMDTFSIQTILDLPCGDFNWIRHLHLTGRVYTGADIVSELIARNQLLYTTENQSFIQIDLMQDPLPAADLIVCRDCLVHFSLEAIHVALKQFKNSGARFLLTTSFPNYPGNYDIKTGQWRPVNLQKAPFNLPQPLMVIPEFRQPGTPDVYEKVLALWDLSAFQER